MNVSTGDDPEQMEFEAAFHGLQETIGQLEQGALTLQESIATFERGIELANRCAAILEAAELRVTQVLETEQVGLDEPAF